MAIWLRLNGGGSTDELQLFVVTFVLNFFFFLKSDLWLKEGFARYTEFVVVDSLFPQWGIWGIFQSSVLSYALDADSQQSTHPIEVCICYLN